MESVKLDKTVLDRKKLLYLTFGLEPGAPSAEIKRAYRNLSLKLHPDASGNPETAGRFSMVRRAYEQLAIAKPDDSIARRKASLAETDDIFSLGKSLVTAGDAETRKRAAIGLGLSGKRSSWVFLRKGLYDTDNDVVAACIKAAAVLGLAQGQAEIASAYERAAPGLKDNILQIARATRDNIFSATLRVARTDSDAKRRAIAYALSSVSKE